ncbi:hypothetical protein [Desertivirga xinjiangensis]|uniref:hypothetical protein n=1 Tax=Desertivirga xinjiangensis TaxID=539206 RepID=UPI002109773B|nr:hypothetical protein [Pedobacter xinjiangensis]
MKLENQIADHLPEAQRAQYLHDNCDNVEEQWYMKKFTPEEIRAMKDALSTLSIDINDIEEEKAKETKKFTDKLKPLKKEVVSLLRNIKMKAVHVKEPLYKMIDHENRKVGFYNHRGELVESRPILPEEMQQKMFPLREGTND